MPNPFALNDPKPADDNPFATNDPRPTPSVHKPATKPAKRNYALSEVPGAALKNLGKGAAEFGNTLKNAYVRDPVNFMIGLPGAAVNAVSAVPGAVADVSGGAYLNMLSPEARKALVDQSPTMKRMSGAAQAVADDYKEAYGGRENIKRTFAEHPVRAAMDLATVIPGAAPTRAINAAADRAVPWAARTAYNVVDPKHATVGRMVGNAAPEIRNAMAASPIARRIIPGSDPTAAQVVANTGRTIPGHPAPPSVVAPRLAAAGKAAANRLPEQAMATKNAQNAARLAAIQRIGGTPADLQAAITARDANAARNYAAAGVTPRTGAPAHPPASVNIPGDAALTALLGRPSMGTAMARAEQLARERGVPFTTTPGVYPADSLHDVKLALDQLIANPERFGIGAADVAAVRNTRNEFIQWFESRNAPYRTARTEFVRDSAPVNQRQIGQYLERRLQNPTLAEDTAALRADDFSRAIQEAVTANPVISKATGRQLFDNLDQIFTPGQMQILNSIQEDLARAKLTDTHAAAGSRYADDINTSFSDSLHVRPDNMLMRPFFTWRNNRIGEELANNMMTPEGGLEMLDNYLMKEGRFNNLDRGVRAMVSPWRIANRYPALYNAYGATEGDKRK